MKDKILIMLLILVFAVYHCGSAETSAEESYVTAPKMVDSQPNVGSRQKAKPLSSVGARYHPVNPRKQKEKKLREVQKDYYSKNDRNNESFSGEQYGKYIENDRISPLKNPFSTFSIDVDTASYTNSRRFLLRKKRMPPANSIRVEEFINYFSYDYPQPQGNYPFSITTEMAPSPFDSERYLLHVAIKGKEIAPESRPASNLVFLLDVSGSMNSENKLGLLKKALIMLSEQMTEKDKVSIVVYAGAAGVVLEPTSGDDTDEIEDALDSLKAGGSTAGSQGIKLAYQKAEEAFIQGGINRVILCTDGDFNVGVTRHEDLIKLIEEKRKSGIALTVLGFGMYNLNDRTMEQIANKGNGNYFYIDTENEAKKVLVTELSSTLQTIAKDVKIQIEFNPEYIYTYRLLGYENRKLKKEDFDKDEIDAGEIGAGHTVTALYEISFNPNYTKVAPQYRKAKNRFSGQYQSKTNFNSALAIFKLRYKQPEYNQSDLIIQPLDDSIVKERGSENFYFSSAVAHFAQKLRKSKYNKELTYSKIKNIMSQYIGKDPYQYREECIEMLEKALYLSEEQ